MITENNVIFKISVGGEVLTPEFQKANSIEMLAFRVVYTAGFAVPTYRLIMSGLNKGYFEKFKQSNDISITFGSDPNHIDTINMETVGHNIREVNGVYLLNWGGVIRKNNLCTRFLESKESKIYNGSAGDVLPNAWKDITGCEVDSSLGPEVQKLERKYRRQHETANNFLVDVFLHMDYRPSFPMATISKEGKLVLRDFQKVKAAGPVAIFSPGNDKYTVQGEYPFVGSPETVSYKTYTNRVCGGYTQVTGRNNETGKTDTFGAGLSEDWKINKLAITSDNETKKTEHVTSNTQNALINSDTPISFHEVAMYNKHNLINMSSISVKLRVEGRLLNDVNVLDLVQLKTGKREDTLSGLYLVEALEQGFVQDTGIVNIIYLCRDNYNDVEKATADPYDRAARGLLNISPKVKAKISNAVNTSRTGLSNARRVLDGTLVNEWERHLIGMRHAALSNFNMFGATIDLNSTESATYSLQNSGANLMNMVIRKFVKEPYSNMLVNAIFGNDTAKSLFLSLLALLLGGQVYTSLYQLISDLIYFDQFLTNYRGSVHTASNIMDPSYTEYHTSGRIDFRETSTGEIVFSDVKVNLSGRRDISTMVTEEEKIQTTNRILDEIKENIPNSLDLPIPPITLTDSEAIKPLPEIKDIIADDITTDLVNRGYVYDSAVVDSPISKDVVVVKPDGSVITPNEAKTTMVSSNSLKQMLLGTRQFDALSAKKITDTVGTTIHTRHWGIFNDYNELVSFNIRRGFVEKYKTFNATKHISAIGGCHIYVAIPASEKNVQFYINSIKVIPGQMEYDDLGYKDARGQSIPYIIYYTPESYNNSNVTLEMRKGI